MWLDLSCTIGGTVGSPPLNMQIAAAVGHIVHAGVVSVRVLLVVHEVPELRRQRDPARVLVSACESHLGPR